MSGFEAFILGLLQGLTEFLPVSSSGHIEIGKALFGDHLPNETLFTVVVHGATVLSTIVVFRKEIASMIAGLFKFKWNDDTIYISKLAVSMIPIGIVGLLFEDFIRESFFGNVMLVGFMLFITGLLLTFAHRAKNNSSKEVGFKEALLIGLAQVIAILPGISRSGSTISAGLLLGVSKENSTKFSFLMVLVPIIGANLKTILSGEISAPNQPALPLIIGFVTAFVSGYIACKWMINIVNRGKLIYFAYYCFFIGSISILAEVFF